MVLCSSQIWDNVLLIYDFGVCQHNWVRPTNISLKILESFSNFRVFYQLSNPILILKSDKMWLALYCTHPFNYSTQEQRCYVVTKLPWSQPPSWWILNAALIINQVWIAKGLRGVFLFLFFVVVVFLHPVSRGFFFTTQFWVTSTFTLDCKCHPHLWKNRKWETKVTH